MFYFKKESFKDCSRCFNIFKLNAKCGISDIYLQEDLVDQMNVEIFKKRQFDFEIENDAVRFFNPSKVTHIIDKSIKEFKEYKTSWVDVEKVQTKNPNPYRPLY